MLLVYFIFSSCVFFAPFVSVFFFLFKFYFFSSCSVFILGSVKLFSSFTSFLAPVFPRFSFLFLSFSSVCTCSLSVYSRLFLSHNSLFIPLVHLYIYCLSLLSSPELFLSRPSHFFPPFISLFTPPLSSSTLSRAIHPFPALGDPR